MTFDNAFRPQPEHSCQNTSSHRMFRMSHRSDDTRSRILWKRLRLTYLWIFWQSYNWPHHFSVRLNPDLPYFISGSLVTLSKKPAGIVIYVCGHTLKWRGKIKTDMIIEAKRGWQCVKIVECDVSLWWAEGDARIVGSPLKQCTRVGNCFHTSYSAAILAVSAIDSVTAVTVQLKLKHVYSLLCVGKKVPE